MHAWAYDQIAAAGELSAIQAVANSALESAETRRELEEAVREQTVQAVAGQLKDDEDLWLEHACGPNRVHRES